MYGARIKSQSAVNNFRYGDISSYVQLALDREIQGLTARPKLSGI